MKIKKCSKCKELKFLSEFYKDKSRKCGRQAYCKSCVRFLSQTKNREKILEYYRAYYKNNKKRLDIISKKYYHKNKRKCSLQSKQYYLKNKEKIKQRSKEFSKKNPDKVRGYKVKHYKKNKNTILKRSKEWKRKNRNKIIEKRKNTPQERLKHNLGNRIRKALLGNTKSLNTMFLIGCEIDYLLYHLQEQFKPGMSWDNYGDWHVDHIKPCASFDLSKPEEQRKCFHYTNLQPLWAGENLSKGNRRIK